MLRLTRELVNQGFDSRQQLMDLLMQINLMESYATLQGMPIEKDLAQKLAQLSGCIRRPEGRNAAEELKVLDDDSVEKAIESAFEVHASLSEMVKPATPESLEASAPRAGLARLTWPRVTDVLIATTFIAVLAFALGVWLKGKWVGAEQLSYMGAALLGASFCGLFTAYKFVQNRTFDPAAGSSYMVRVVLGTVSGLILANIGISLLGGSASQSPTLAALGPGTLALIGGYSADAVNLILQRIADTLVTTVRGSADDSLKAKQVALEAEAKTADFLQRQATVVALSDMLKSATDDTMKNNIQALMSAVSKGSVGEDILKPVTTNGSGQQLDLSAKTPMPVDTEAVKAAQGGSTDPSSQSAPLVAPGTDVGSVPATAAAATATVSAEAEQTPNVN